jgi:putative acetyltransferase
MQTHLIRKIIPSDNAPLAKMIREVFEEHGAPKLGTVYSDPTTDDLYSLFQIPRAILWVAELENKIAGCCGVYPTPGLQSDCAELVKFYLPAGARGKGIGKDLMERCTASAIELGYRELYLESLPQFAKAVNMYEKQGYRKLNNPLGNSGHSACNIWMVKKLQAI